MRNLARFIIDHEDWLLDRVLRYAHARNYTKYAPPTQPAYRMAIAGLSASLAEELEKSDDIPEFGPDDDFQSDPLTRFGTITARRHRDRGATLPMFLGLMKYFRQAYVDLVREEGTNKGRVNSQLLFIERCFDRMEIAICEEWAETGRDDLVAELQAANRTIATQKNAYLTVFESLSDPAIILGDDHEIINLNHAAGRLLPADSTTRIRFAHPAAIAGRENAGAMGPLESSGESCIGRRVEDVFPWLAAYVECLGTAAGTDVAEVEASTAEAQRWFEATCARMVDTHEKFTAAVLTLRDITERKQAEARQTLVREVLEVLNQPSATTDVIEDLLHAMQRFTGVEAVGIRLKEGEDYPYYRVTGFSQTFVRAENSLCVHDASGEIVREPTGCAVVECMCGNVIRGRVDPALPFFTPSGSYHASSTSELLASTTEADRLGRTRNRCNSEGFESVTLIPLRSGGETIGLLQLNDRRKNKIQPGLVPFLEEIGSTIGIALKRKQGEQLAQRLAAIVESSEDAIIGTDLTGTITSWNAGAQRLYGYTADEAIGARTVMLVPSERLAEIDDIFATIRSDECVHQLETVRRRKDGCALHVSMSVSPIHGPDGQVVGASAIARDITDRRRAEEQQRRLEEQLQQGQKLESLGVLAGGIAHDFNNLLVGILGNAELVLDGMPTDARERESIERIRRSANRAADLTKQMLAYSGKGRFVVEPLDLSARVREMSELLNTSMSKSVRLHKELAEDLPRIEADAAQMSQVIMNLITNASEAIGDGGGTVSLRTGVMEVDAGYLAGARVGADAPGGQYVYIEVCDSGCGMDEETAARIFEPFFTTKFTGRGLGLAAVLGIVRGHHGAIKVESSPGQGTAIRVMFPVTGRTVRAHASSPRTSPTPNGAGTVLVVDDEEEVRSVARDILERDGFRVLLAEDGRVAQTVFREHAADIDVVLLDLTMPHAGGEATLDEIRRVRNDAAVVVSSGYTAEDVSQRFAGTELSGFLQKPYTAASLTGMVRAAVQVRRGGSLQDTALAVG